MPQSNSRTDAIPLTAFLPRIEKPTMADILDKETFKRLCKQVQDDQTREDMIQVRALLQAGWKYELPGDGDYDPYQWYWRAPPKRANSRGRKYLSTNQAFNAMRKAQP